VPPIHRRFVSGGLALAAFFGSAGLAFAQGGGGISPYARSTVPEFASCGPESDAVGDLVDGMGRSIPGTQPVALDFCEEWNPEFGFNGHRCCSKVLRSRGGGRRRRHTSKYCPNERFKKSFCDEMTADQNQYVKDAAAGKFDILQVIGDEMGRKGDQAYCSVNNGFLAWGRPVVATPGNRVLLRSTDRCTHFGTDNMVGLVEWTGRQVAKQYSEEGFEGVRLVVGDITSPRGGCLAGRNSARGHASHTNGQDADIGFLSVRRGKTSPDAFITDFDGKLNWWLIKQVFKNPYACVKVMFLDKRLIRKLGKAARGDEDWNKYWRYIRHMPSHRNHFHVRIGDGPGLPGCVPGANPEDETGEGEGSEGAEGPDGDVDLEALDGAVGGGKKAASVSRAPVVAKPAGASELGEP
jgi:murein endopeptidase